MAISLILTHLHYEDTMLSKIQIGFTTYWELKPIILREDWLCVITSLISVIQELHPNHVYFTPSLMKVAVLSFRNISF